MPSGLTDAVAGMVSRLLAFDSVDCTYKRGHDIGPDTITMHKRPQKPLMIDNGDGTFAAVKLVDFICDPGTLPFGQPAIHDEISDGTGTYRVVPQDDLQSFQVAPGMIRIHTKQMQ